MATDRIVMRNAYRWDCPLCSAVNYVDPVPVPEDDVRKSLGIEPWEAIPPEYEGTWDMTPSQVGCSSCGMGFEITADNDPREGD